MAPLRGGMEAGRGKAVRGKGLNSAVRAAMLLATAALPACSTMQGVQQALIGGAPPGGEPPRLRGFIGAAVADEPQAALAGREVLALGGTAADAAVAIGMMLAVTLPSRAGLGGGGACLAYDPRKTGPGGGKPEAILFLPVAPSAPGPESDRPASVPMLARGLFLLQARYGTQPFETLVAPAERLARLGAPVSRALADDLALVAGPLSADPDARAIFAPDGTPLVAGATLVQPDLAVTLAQLRTSGVGGLYQGPLAARFVQGAGAAGGGLRADDLRKALPTAAAAIVVPAGHDQVAFLPPPADGGLAAAAAFRVLFAHPSDVAGAQATALAAAAHWRAGGVTAAAVLAQAAAQQGTSQPGIIQPETGGTLPALPASTTFATLDRTGQAVACAVTMDNLFGTGRVAAGTGVVLAASPKAVPLPLLAAAVAWNTNVGAFRAEVAGSGQEGAAFAVADGMADALHSHSPMPTPVPDPGRANAIACWDYLPSSNGSCGWATDPRGTGFAAAGN
jgi:gamma-glutamyltranspeptidase/glutathione hydrolase